MKPKELCKKIGFTDGTPHGNVYKWGGDYYTFSRYYNQDRVVAYYQSNLGVLMLIKGIRKPFYFVVLHNDLYFGGHNYKLSRLSEQGFFKFTRNNIKVLDKKYFDEIKIRNAEQNI